MKESIKVGNEITKEFEKFISKDESLVHTNHIIKWNGLAVATNGHVMVWAECEDKPTSISRGLIGFISSLIEKHQTLDFKSFIFPELSQKPCSICEGKGFVYQKATEECSECHGDGSLDLESNCNTYNVQCQSCDGHGSTDSDKPGSKVRCTSSGCFNGLQFEDMMPFEDGVLNPCYLNDFRNYPDIQVATTPDESGAAKIFYFKSSNGINAIIMGCRP